VKLARNGGQRHIRDAQIITARVIPEQWSEWPNCVGEAVSRLPSMLLSPAFRNRDARPIVPVSG
jgi:hypothetical protein